MNRSGAPGNQAAKSDSPTFRRLVGNPGVKPKVPPNRLEGRAVRRGIGPQIPRIRDQVRNLPEGHSCRLGDVRRAGMPNLRADSMHLDQHDSGPNLRRLYHVNCDFRQ